ncbi:MULTISPECIES: bifunctional alpha/beta hydrolase/OsmC family protein [unclassified Sphingomonas]|uniref:bifunctional alpha/beta hydrolase/OsmC family protein n=1 Tax=unclassified Sphingomonas TaxID=196159 RepID=UPI0006F3C431|nr:MULTISPECIES: alpha/beta fold hydrolase [unclassified Sphingomonas]KQX18717.1 osmotically inducible protein C [Sphingomonas sp. Root1294]KQY71959.1 osmotically inducible protein C [Sphingomonas sp. Root50]KRB94776.1 osmotically inducible protein C [Sphingomonas sp. Root720]
MPTQVFDFDGGSHRLSGRLELPEGTPRGWALFAHCFTCGKDQWVAVRIARALAAIGIGTLRFDFAGIGASEGTLAGSSFAADRRDLIAAAEAMAAAGHAPALLVGHSLGGAAALAAAGDIPSIKAVATIAAPFDVAHVLRHFDEASVDAIERDGEADVMLAGRTFRIGKPFLDDLRRHDLGARIAVLHRPLMILHGPFDEVVDIENATSIFLAARHPKSFVSLDKADHLLTGPGEAEHVARLIAAWAAPYLPRSEPTRDQGDADVVAEETGAGRFQVAIQAGGIRFLADEPAAVGGLGSGPTPYHLLSAGLAACTTMTLRLYADQKGWEIGRIRTAVGHAKRKSEAPADLFTRRIDFDGAVDAERRARLLEIADRCPVHRTLENTARVETSIGGPPAAAEPIAAHMNAVEGLVEDAE